MGKHTRPVEEQALSYINYAHILMMYYPKDVEYIAEAARDAIAALYTKKE